MTHRSVLHSVALGLAAVFLPVAHAYPPAPDHVIFGTVRDERGKALVKGEGVIIAYAGTTELVRSTSNDLGDEGINYILRIPMDAGRLGAVYKPSAVLPASSITFRVIIGNVSNIPIQVSRVAHTIGEPGGRTRLDLTLGVDIDGDGLPDAWERSLIDRDSTGRLKTLADVKPGDDADGDGLTNLQEFLLGTYQLDKLDGVSLSIVAVENGRARLRFATIPGRVYTIRSSTELNTWTAQNFALSASAPGLQGSFTGTDITLVDVWAPLPPGGSAFYRIYAK
ncbi:MAG: hypothetical protein ACKPB0_11165 [Opitutaceae bacterium]